MAEELNTYVASEIPVLAENLRDFIVNSTNVDVGFESLVQFLSDIADEQKQSSIELSRTNPDFESIRIQFQARLRQKDSWRDLIRAGVGETILEFVAAIGDYAQTSILRAYQETSYDARLTSSVYTITRMLGVHIGRKTPGEVPVKLWGESADSLSDYVIPRMSQFDVGGVPCFNREAIVFNNNTEDNPLEVTLHQGSVTVEKFISSGTPFQSIEVGQNDYLMSDKDIYCFVDDNIEYFRDIRGPWHFSKSDLHFFENSVGSGNVEILFGNSVFGRVPPIDSILSIVYATTDGAAANTANSGQAVTLVSVNDSVPDRIKGDDADEVAIHLTKEVLGVSVAGIFNGDDEPDKEFLKVVGPSIRASGGRAVSRPDHRGLGLNFPGVADVYFQGQRELGRYRPSLMNVVGVTVLKKDGTAMDAGEWEAYTKYLRELEIWRAEFKRIDPVPVDFDLYADIYMKKDSDITNVYSWAKQNAIRFFKPQLGSLGKSVYKNDAETIMKVNYANMHTDYLRNVKPDQDRILSRIEWPRLRNFDCKVDYGERGYSSLSARELFVGDS